MEELLKEITFLEWIGYSASLIIALSMTMNSIVKFRLINLAGAGMFSTYGFIIGAYPVGILNAFIFCVDIYYLVGIYAKKETFETLEVRADNRYLIRFLEFHNKEIQKFFPGFIYKPEMNTISFFVLRNMAVAGLFLGHRSDNQSLRVGLDFVIPEYRDFKNGKFVYVHLKKKFHEQGIRKIVASPLSPKHAGYLTKLGFIKNGEGLFEKELY